MDRLRDAHGFTSGEPAEFRATVEHPDFTDLCLADIAARGHRPPRRAARERRRGPAAPALRRLRDLRDLRGLRAGRGQALASPAASRFSDLTRRTTPRTRALRGMNAIRAGTPPGRSSTVRRRRLK